MCASRPGSNMPGMTHTCAHQRPMGHERRACRFSRVCVQFQLCGDTTQNRQEWITWRFPLRSCALSLPDHRFYLRCHRRDASPGWEGKPAMALRSKLITNIVPMSYFFPSSCWFSSRWQICALLVTQTSHKELQFCRGYPWLLRRITTTSTEKLLQF